MTEKILTVEQSEKLACMWFGHFCGKHHWVDTIDGYQRCANCKQIREKPKTECPQLSGYCGICNTTH